MGEQKKALLIGNDIYYNVKPLTGCVNDVNAIEKLLANNADGSSNYFTALHHNLTNQRMRQEIQNFFKRPASEGLLYFAGHGIVTDEGGFICGKDAEKGSVGVSMRWLNEVVMKAEISHLTIILDCCHAGELFNNVELEGDFSTLPKGVSFLAATNRDDTAVEHNSRGVFSVIMEQGLNGASADLFGNVTAADLFALAQNRLSPFQQRPVFKAATDHLVPIRKCNSPVDIKTIRRLKTVEFFPDIDSKINVNPDILNKNKAEHDIDYSTYLTLFEFEKAGLIACEKTNTLIEETYQWGTCFLSPYGQHIWDLIDKKRI